TTNSDEPDSVLLDQFIADGDETAFEALLQRHGPRVYQICSRWSLEVQDAEDAFQATFLALVSRAKEIRSAGSLGAWIGCVARRIAIRERMRMHRVRRHEEPQVSVDEIARLSTSDVNDVKPLVQAEIARLPQKYRRVVELCFLQGLTNDEAAR